MSGGVVPECDGRCCSAFALNTVERAIQTLFWRCSFLSRPRRSGSGRNDLASGGACHHQRALFLRSIRMAPLASSHAGIGVKSRGFAASTPTAPICAPGIRLRVTSATTAGDASAPSRGRVVASETRRARCPLGREPWAMPHSSPKSWRLTEKGKAHMKSTWRHHLPIGGAGVLVFALAWVEPLLGVAAIVPLGCGAGAVAAKWEERARKAGR